MTSKFFLFFFVFSPITCYFPVYSASAAEHFQLDKDFGENGLVIMPPSKGIIDNQQLLIRDNDSFTLVNTLKGNNLKLSVSVINKDGHIRSTITNTLAVGRNNILSKGDIIDKQGRPIVAYTKGINPSNLFVTRFKSDGSIDHTFGEKGTVSTNARAIIALDGFVTHPSGRFCISWNSYTTKRDKIGRRMRFPFIACYDSKGNLDKQYGNKGLIKISKEPADVRGIAFHADGSLIAVISKISDKDSGYLLRIDKFGIIDSSFGAKGVAYIASFTNTPELVVNEHNQILIAADKRMVDKNGVGFSVLRIFRLNADGTPDISFGKKGIVDDITPFFSQTRTFSINRDNNILIGGFEKGCSGQAQPDTFLKECSNSIGD